MTRPQLYIIRGPDGHPEAIHQRTERGPKDKSFTWWTAGPDGQPVSSLQGRKVDTLPLFGSQHVGKWDTSRPVLVVEGEKCTMALASAGHRALGAIGGSAPPGPEPLAVLSGLDVLLWPDNDDAGRRLMAEIHRRIEIGARSVRWLIWSDAPAGGDAADYLAAGLSVDKLVGRAVRVPVPPAPMPRRSRRRDVSMPSSSDVTDALWDIFGLRATAGRSVRCPMHDDRRPSFHIFADNKRAMCHSGSCAFNGDGHGVSAYDIRHTRVTVTA